MGDARESDPLITDYDFTDYDLPTPAQPLLIPTIASPVQYGESYSEGFVATAILFIGLLVFVGHLLSAVFARTRIPDVLILMMIGVLFGPYVLKRADPSDFGKIGPVFSTVALIIILFEGGMHLKIKTLAASLHTTVLLTFLTLLFTFPALAGIVYIFVKDVSLSMLLAAALSSTSAAVILPLVHSLKMSEESTAIVTMETVIEDVTCIVLTYGILEYVLSKGTSGSIVSIFAKMVIEIFIAAVIGLVGAIGWMAIVDYLRRVPNTLFAEFAFACMLYGGAESVHASGPVAVLVFGVAAINLPTDFFIKIRGLHWLRLGAIHYEKRTMYTEVVFLTKLAFFIYLGLSIRLNDWLAWSIGAALVLVMYLVRYFVSRASLPRTMPWRDAFIISVMTPKGLVTAVLASVLVIKKIPQAEFMQDIAFAVVFLSILMTSILIPVGAMPVAAKITRKAFGQFAELPAEESGDHSPGPILGGPNIQVGSVTSSVG